MKIFLLVVVTCYVAGFSAEDVSEESCFDGIKNQDEEEVDCGGLICEPCLWSFLGGINKDADKKARSNGADRVVGGDILQNMNSKYEEEKQATEALKLRKTVYGPVNWHRRLWFMREIPYFVNHPGDTGSRNPMSRADVEQKIAESLDTITRNTKGCIRFKKYPTSQLPYAAQNLPGMPKNKNWIEINKSFGCYSGIGRNYYQNSATRISLGNNCIHPSIIVHEVLHALGFFHEQSRRDRDSYVRINKGNIQTAFIDNFEMVEKNEMDPVGTAYDLKSIMHYSKKTFIRGGVTGNTIESIWDKNMKLGSDSMTETDKKEIYDLYQCNIKSGWSNWFSWSPCIMDWKKKCKRQRGRFCISGDCPYMDEYGTDNQLEECEESKCTYGAPVDGIWGNWGPFGACSVTCHWGVQERQRKCNNPSPRNGGKSCPGSDKELNVCRVSRCLPASMKNFAKYDNDFESGLGGMGGWSLERTDGRQWKTRSFRGPNNAGPQSAFSGSKYAVFEGFDRGYGRTSNLISPRIEGHRLWFKCLTLHYQLNGEHIHPTKALVISTREVGGSRRIEYEKSIRGSHQGNRWLRMAITIPKLTYPYKIWITATMGPARNADVAIDQITFESSKPGDGRCPQGLNGPVCKDFHANCAKWANTGECTKNQIWMTRECCYSCSRSPPCVDKNAGCKNWACEGECKANPIYMLVNCCKSCQNNGQPCDTTCTGDKYARKADCERWAKEGECKKNAAFMIPNCCKSCETYGK